MYSNAPTRNTHGDGDRCTHNINTGTYPLEFETLSSGKDLNKNNNTKKRKLNERPAKLSSIFLFLSMSSMVAVIG